jgi:hypothetical protein
MTSTVNAHTGKKIPLFEFNKLINQVFLLEAFLLNHREPVNCPNTAKPINSGMQILGVPNQIRKGIINGIEA